ncbi:MAG: S8 family peptidase [Ignavibacteria bacterium]|nr:S8 family peptidase [Ignavibacteria bacterium]
MHTGVNLSRAYTGKGVVLGVVDSGIDWAHPDFRSSSGSRIQYIWDMSDSTSTAAAPPPEYGYGRQYAKAAIDAGACLERDLQDGHGHGTHVTGTAAGNGGMNREYTGIAPESDIVFVKGFRSGPGFKDTDVINGCDFIFKRAAAMQKPAVINLSLGGQLGAHDGSSLYEQALSNLVGPGRIIVASAGNSGGQRMHVRYTTGGDATEPRVTFFRVPQGAPSAVIDIWYSGGPVNVGLAWYNDYPWNLGNSPLVGGGSMLDGINVFGNVAGIVNVGSDPSNGLGHATLALMQTGFGTALSNLLFAVYTTGSGTLDGWLLNGEFGPTQNAENHIFPGDYESSVGMPATAKKLISVGSYVTKNQWVDENGVTQTQDGNPAPGTLSSFSSTGPSRDRRQKPEISAPGEAILSALSADCGADAASILFGGGYQKMQGTSMASPHVAGVVALMLERNSSLDYPDVLGALTSTARKDALTGATPNTRFGYGKVDALAAVQAVTPKKVPGDVTPTSVTLSVSPNPAAASMSISYALPHAGSISLRLFDALGREVRSLENGFREAGNYSVRFDGSGLPDGVYFCSLLSAGGNATMRVVLR